MFPLFLEDLSVMGTRNLTCVILNGQFKVAQYGQWDGYPEGQGITVLQFLRDKMLESQFRQKVSALREITDKDLEQKWTEFGHTGGAFVSLDVSEKFAQCYPHLHRDCAAEILEIIQDSPAGLELKLDTSFASEHSCEYAYVIDLDERNLHVYSRYDRYENTEINHFEKVLVGEQPAVKQIVSFSFYALPSNDDFIKIIQSFYKSEEEVS
jgi:hypothetical protein